MNKLLVVVDMQNDFIYGALGTPEAQAIVPNVCKKIREWDGDVICTLDTHQKDYMNTLEGKYLPVPHCIYGEPGWSYNDAVSDAANAHPRHLNPVFKPTFGSFELAEIADEGNYDYIELIGLCTDICVVSNALLLRATFPNTEIGVDASCCAGVTPESHAAALLTMKMCQIQILNEGAEKDEPQKELD